MRGAQNALCNSYNILFKPGNQGRSDEEPYGINILRSHQMKPYISTMAQINRKEEVHFRQEDRTKTTN